MPGNEVEAEKLVRLLYSSLLNREADSEGLAGKVSALTSGRKTVSEVITEILESPEYVTKKTLSHLVSLTKHECFPDKDIFPAPDVVEALFAKTAGYWRNKGSQRDEMYYSVLSNPPWRKELDVEEKRSFIRTGEPYAKRVLELYRKLSGRATDKLECIDFGAGVGRLALNFAPHVGKVYAVDFSDMHLQELAANAALFGNASNVVTWKLDALGDLQKLPRVGLVYSFIALQHNTPPVIACLIRSLLTRLQPGGYAFLHVTLASVTYAGFSIDNYLSDPHAGSEMEVHILPRANINTIAEQARCDIVMSHCIGGNRFAYSEEIVFRKRGD